MTSRLPRIASGVPSYVSVSTICYVGNRGQLFISVHKERYRVTAKRLFIFSKIWWKPSWLNHFDRLLMISHGIHKSVTNIHSSEQKIEKNPLSVEKQCSMENVSCRCSLQPLQILLPTFIEKYIIVSICLNSPFLFHLLSPPQIHQTSASATRRLTPVHCENQGRHLKHFLKRLFLVFLMAQVKESFLGVKR